MIYILLGILGWLLSGFASFVIFSKVIGYTEMDEEAKDTLSKCLLGGLLILIFITIVLFVIFMQEFCDKFLNRLLKWMNGDKKNE